MTSRERVLKAINHEEADRVPIDIGGTKSTGVHVDEYIKLGKYLGLDVELPKVFDQFQMLARVDEPLRSWFRTDVVQLENYCEYFDLFNRDWKVWENNNKNKVLMPGGFDPEIDEKGYIYLRDKKGRLVAEMAPTSLYFERYADPSYTSPDEFMPPEEWSASIPLYADEELKVLQTRAKYLHENTEYSVSGGFGKLKMTTTGIMAGQTFTDWLCLLFTDPGYINEVLEATALRNIENLKLYFEAVEPYIDTVFVSTTDYGTQRGELFSPDTFRGLYVPNLRLVNDYIHENTHVKTLYHSCGSIGNIIGHMVDAGIDIINPVQVTAENMDPAALKAKHGDKIVFWGGGVDTQTTYQFGTPEEVREQVRERIKILGKGGGYVFTPVHNTQNEVPVENVVAMRDAALEYGVYA